jgi:hypothetical protein
MPMNNDIGSYTTKLVALGCIGAFEGNSTFRFIKIFYLFLMIRLVNWLNFGTTFDGLLLLFGYEGQGSYNYILHRTISN